MDINVTETMNFLIQTIIERMEKYSLETGAPIGQKKKKINVAPLSFSTNEQTYIKLDSKKLISKSTKRSIQSYKTVSSDYSNHIYNYFNECC